MKKKWLPLLMTLCMALSLFPAAALAADTAATASAVRTLPFTDVASGAWCYDAVSYVYDNGLLRGVTAAAFAPNGSMSRAMLLSALYRLAGSPAVAGADGAVWYGGAQKWAVDSGISGGTNMTAAVSRQQLVTLLCKYAKSKSLGLGLPANYFTFTAASVADYAAADPGQHLRTRRSARPTACFKASITRFCVICLSIAHPTTLPEYRSITAARYSQPSRVLI